MVESMKNKTFTLNVVEKEAERNDVIFYFVFRRDDKSSYRHSITSYYTPITLVIKGNAIGLFAEGEEKITIDTKGLILTEITLLLQGIEPEYSFYQSDMENVKLDEESISANEKCTLKTNAEIDVLHKCLIKRSIKD
jgi:hypothetical protein